VTSQTRYALAPLRRRSCAWLIDATLGLLLAAGLALVAGGRGDVSTLWHMVAFKSANGQVGRQLSAAANPGSPDLTALKPLLGLLALLLIFVAAGIAYRVVTTALWGAGVGKMVLGLQIVVDSQTVTRGDIPDWGRSWRRWAVPQATGLIPLPATGMIAFLPAFRDSRRRGLHDRAAGTVVIDVRSPLPSAPAPVPAYEASVH
jgi:uncharacterized RDD family membrane protein YckC